MHVDSDMVLKLNYVITTAYYLTIRQRSQVVYEQIVNEVQPSWLSLIDNEDKLSIVLV